MRRVNIYGAEIGYDVRGAGEPLLLIHGTTLVDAFYPIFADPVLAGGYRIITYHRRGYGLSSRSCSPLTMSQEGTEARALLRHLGIARHILQAIPMAPTLRFNGRLMRLKRCLA